MSEHEYESRLNDLKAMVEELCELCYVLKRQIDQEMLRDNPEMAAMLSDCRLKALRAFMSFNLYASAAIADQVDTNLFIQLSDFMHKFRPRPLGSREMAH